MTIPMLVPLRDLQQRGLSLECLHHDFTLVVTDQDRRLHADICPEIDAQPATDVTPGQLLPPHVLDLCERCLTGEHVAALRRARGSFVRLVEDIARAQEVDDPEGDFCTFTERLGWALERHLRLGGRVAEQLCVGSCPTHTGMLGSFEIPMAVELSTMRAVAAAIWTTPDRATRERRLVYVPRGVAIVGLLAPAPVGVLDPLQEAVLAARFVGPTSHSWLLLDTVDLRPEPWWADAFDDGMVEDLGPMANVSPVLLDVFVDLLAARPDDIRADEALETLTAAHGVLAA